MLLIPEEVQVPRVLAEARRHAQAFGPPTRFVDAVVDGEAHRHVARANPARPLASALKAQAEDQLVDQAAAASPAALGAAQRHRLLGSVQALRRVRARVLMRDAHPDWWLPPPPPRPPALSLRRRGKPTEVAA